MRDSDNREWLPIPGHEVYEVNRDGQVRSWKWGSPRPMRQHYNGMGYLRVSFHDQHGYKHYPIHRLVAITFLGLPPDGCEVNHIDGIRTNNHISNLEWITHQENVAHAISLGLRNHAHGEGIGNAKLTEEQVRRIRQLYVTGDKTMTELGTMFEVDRKTVAQVVHWKTWRHVV